MKEGWKIVKLSEIGDVQTGPFGAQLHQKDYVKNGSPIITVEHLGELGITRQNLPQVSDTDKERLSRFILRKGDVVFSRVGSVDRNCLVTEAEEGWLFSGRLLRIRPNERYVNPKYLSCFFHTPKFKTMIQNRSVGGIMPSLNTKLMSDVLILLPPLPEQKRIAEILTAADSAIEEADRAVKESERAKQGLMQKLIPDSEDELKEEWTVGTISDIAVISPKINKSHLTESTSVSFIPMASISESGKVIEMEVKKYSEVKSGFTSFEDGDVLFAKITPCMENGKGALVNNLVNGVGFGSTEFFVLRAIESASNEFLYQITVSKFFRHKALSYLKGTAGQQRVSRELFTMLNFPIPPLNEQKRIADILKTADEKIELCKQRKALLEKTKQGLMQKLLGA